MAFSVDVDDRTASRLKKLQDEIESRTGREVSQQDVLAELVKRAFESKSELVDLFRESKLPLSDAETEAFFSGTTASGKETDEENIDEILYGDTKDV